MIAKNDRTYLQDRSSTVIRRSKENS